ncbi:MAG: hypothetical protein IPG92_00975 [Flavobacteriales bacterium]|nr:hypothetical protein [Flavobacteriales bacterium]
MLRLTGPSAPIQFDELPSFYLRFDDQGAAFDSSVFAVPGCPHIANPRDLELALMDPKADARELETALMNCFTYRPNIDPNHLRPFDIEQIAPRTFKITLRELGDGEYCFISRNAGRSASRSISVFDFGIQRTQPIPTHPSHEPTN